MTVIAGPRGITIRRGPSFRSEGYAECPLYAGNERLATLLGSYVIQAQLASDGNHYGNAVIGDDEPADVAAERVREQIADGLAVFPSADLTLELDGEKFIAERSPSDSESTLRGMRFTLMELTGWNSYGSADPLPVTMQITEVLPNAALTVGDIARHLEVQQEQREAERVRVAYEVYAQKIRLVVLSRYGARIEAVGQLCVDPEAERARVAKKAALENEMSAYAKSLLAQMIAAERIVQGVDSLPAPPVAERLSDEEALARANMAERRRQRRRLSG